MGESNIRRFTECSADRMFAACRRAVSERGWSIQNTDSAGRTLSFATGMSWRSWSGQQMSVVVEEALDGAVEVIVGGRRDQRGNPFGGGGGQLYDWGEKGAITRQFFDSLMAALPKVPEPAVSTSEAPTASSSATVDELERLSNLHASGALDDDEYRRAKSRLLGE